MNGAHGGAHLATACGGLVVDDDGRILLREVANHYDGYVWTFAKGRPEPNETPEQAALREVHEETGVEAEIVEPLPGDFPGGTTINSYYIMSVVTNHGTFDARETASVRWCTLAEARQNVRRTTNATGRSRDLAVLAAFERWRGERSPASSPRATSPSDRQPGKISAVNEVSALELRALREASGHTQVQVADFLGVAQSLVSQWELGTAPLPVGQVALLSKILDAPVETVGAAAETTRKAWLESRDLRVADAIRGYRVRAGLTREQVAEACDCTASAVTLWENGTARPDRSRLASLTELFEVGPADFLEGAGLHADEVSSYLTRSGRDVTVLATMLREGRVAADLSQAQVAAAVGLSQNGVSAIETSVHLPSPEVLARMTKLFELDRLEVMAARYETRRGLGHIPDVALPWPLRPADVPRVRWFRQLRAHMGSTRAELAEALEVPADSIRSAEQIESAGLPVALRSSEALSRLAILGGCTSDQLVAAWEPGVADLVPLLDLEGVGLVEACQSVAQLLRLLHFRGKSWTEMGDVAGTSRQSPINWSRGSVPAKDRVIALGGIFEPAVSQGPMESLWYRSKHPAEAKVSVEEAADPMPGTPDWIFAESRLDAGLGQD